MRGERKGKLPTLVFAKIGGDRNANKSVRVVTRGGWGGYEMLLSTGVTRVSVSEIDQDCAMEWGVEKGRRCAL